MTQTFDYQIRALVYYHIETFSSGLDLLQVAESDRYVDHLLVPLTGLGQSTFYEANATRGNDHRMCGSRVTTSCRRKAPLATDPTIPNGPLYPTRCLQKTLPPSPGTSRI